jgi:hypothetical protein
MDVEALRAMYGGPGTAPANAEATIAEPLPEIDSAAVEDALEVRLLSVRQDGGADESYTVCRHHQQDRLTLATLAANR